MKREIKIAVFALLIFLPGVSARAQVGLMPRKVASAVGTDYLEWNVSAVCSARREDDAFLQSWIRRRFEAAGLEPLGGKWSHSFRLPDGRIGRNVVGCIPGTSGKWIVVGAYYDGIGTVDGRFYPGADSNASGIAALVSLASSVGRNPKDGLIFVAFDGHGCGYAGARALLAELGRSRIRLMVNLDTMGSTLSPVELKYGRYLIALGAEKYSRDLRRCARTGGIKLYYDYYRSDKFTNLFYRRVGDQRVFLEAGVPAVVFTSGITMNTNKITDTPETLDYEVLRARVLCISRWLSLISSSK